MAALAADMPTGIVMASPCARSVRGAQKPQINQPLTNAAPQLDGASWESQLMAALIFICPKTGRPIESGIETDRASLSNVQSVRIRVRCPHCWEEHDRRIRDAHLASAAYVSLGEAVMY